MNIKYLIPILLFLIILLIANKNQKKINIDELTKRQNATSFSGTLESTNIFYNGKGFIYYEKPNKFRLILNLKSNKEIDIGSNEKLYWFWYEKFSKKVHYWKRNSTSDVIPEFHPDFIKQIIDLDFKKLNEDYQNVNYLIINNQIIKKVLTIKNKKIQCFFYEDNKEILNFEIAELKDDEKYIIPELIVLNSKSLGSIAIKIKDIKINEKIEESVWEMPKINSINISK